MALTTRGRAGRLIAVVTTLALGVGLGALSGVASAADASSAGIAQSGDLPPQDPAPVKGTWKQNAAGWWWYELPDGSYPAGVDMTIDGAEYTFDDWGYMRTGWVQEAGGWRYYLPSGARLTGGWVQVGGSWYYVEPSTKLMATGYTIIDNTAYYLDDTTGAMVTGCRRPAPSHR